MGVAGWAKRLRAPWVLVTVLVVNAVGIAYGFYYYVPQFARTPWWLWPLVPDSPFAVLLMSIALVLIVLGRGHRWVNLVGSVAMVKVGVWTAFVLVFFADHFRFSLLPVLGCAEGVLGCGNMNTALFYLHLGMALEALIVADLLPVSWRAFAGVGGAFVLVDILDYTWPVDHLSRGCSGLFPHTVPCTQHTVTFVVTVLITVATAGGLYALHRKARGEHAGPRT